jgi:hypothetical protein
MINLSKLQWIVVGVVVLIVIVLLDVLIGTTITPRLIATPTPTMPTNVLFVKLRANGDCRENWFHACDLQTALSNALPGEEIWAVRGTYKPTSEEDQRATFQLKSGVALYGGFAGNETSRDERNWEENITILSGDIDGNDITENDVITDTANIKGENSYHVVTGSGTDDTAILDGFTITGGQANGSEPDDRGGGGMYNDGGSPKLTNVTFSGNVVADYGGGMFNGNSSRPELTDVTFSGNTGSAGGGMHNYLSSPHLTDVIFSGNTADGGGGIFNNASNPTLVNCVFNSNSATGGGGGMFNYSNSSPVLTNVIFSGNRADTSGGGMHNEDSNPRLTSTEFISNTATSADGDAFGGGMYNINSSPTLTNTNFISNTATTIPPQAAQRYAFGGGMHNRHNSSPTLTNTNFISNTAKQDGGGMYNLDNSSPTLTNVIFRENKAKFGGGLYDTESSGPTLTNVTFYGNIAEGASGGGSLGGGICNWYNIVSITLTNCIMWDNTAPAGPEIHNEGNSTTEFSYSLVKGEKCPEKSTCKETKFNADPEFVNPDKGDLHLQLGSPALDAGYNAAVADVPTDLDGNPRIACGVVDMGAYERQTCP